MVVRKITISLEENAYQAATAAARAAGLSLSAWLSRYAEHRARVEEGLRAVAAYEAEYGASAVPAGRATVDRATVDRDAVDRDLDDLGIGEPTSPDREAEFAAALSRLRSA